MFAEISLAIITLRQDGLIQKAERYNDGNGRVNNHVISRSSPFLKTLNDTIENIDLYEFPSAATWNFLKVADIIGLHSPSVITHLKRLLQQALEDITQVHPSTIGLLLPPSASETPAFAQILPVLAPNGESLLADYGFLEGFELSLSQLSMYTHPFPV